MKLTSTLLLAAASMLALQAHAEEAPLADDGPTLAAGMAASEPAGSSSDDAAAEADKPSGYPRIGVHIGSRHWPEKRPDGVKWNNFNPGLNVRWANGITAGVYRNSESRTSFYAGWTWTRKACGPALTFGAITGYTQGTIPMVLPSLCVFDHYRITFIPRLEPKGASVLHLALEF